MFLACGVDIPSPRYPAQESIATTSSDELRHPQLGRRIAIAIALRTPRISEEEEEEEQEDEEGRGR
eukprot:8673796-Pyramimonas_sp.AAC.1